MTSQHGESRLELDKHIRNNATTGSPSVQQLSQRSHRLSTSSPDKHRHLRPSIALTHTTYPKNSRFPHIRKNRPPPQRVEKLQRVLPTKNAMSGFFSSEAERALMGQEEDAQILFNEQRMMLEATTPYVDEGSNWAHAHTSDSGFDYFHPLPQPLANTYPTMTSSPEFSDYTSASTAGSVLPLTYPPSSSSMLPTPSSHQLPSSLSVPSTVGSGAGSSSRGPSRSPSPHAADLYNYGTLNTDHRTWRCAYPGCNSKAIFVRPCDLRKHFHRHNKQFFCRHEGCPQATEGGFSSKKDRARHESKHNPGVPCEWEGCERIFSRVDNMRNHMQRSKQSIALEPS